MTPLTDSDLQSLAVEWNGCKQAVKEAQARLLQAEIAIYEAVKTELPEKGTSTFGPIKVVTGFTESYDQSALNIAYEQWPDGIPFPFMGEWKPDGKQLSYLRDHRPELYDRLTSAITIKPKKPAFAVKD